METSLPERRFRSAAQYYLSGRPFYSSLLIRRVVELCDLDATHRMLDLGCGPGQLAAAFVPFVERARSLPQNRGAPVGSNQLNFPRFASANRLATVGRSLVVSVGYGLRGRSPPVLQPADPRSGAPFQGSALSQVALRARDYRRRFGRLAVPGKRKGFRLQECLVFLLCLLVLTINSLVFDYRDVSGDAALGTGTLPVRLGRKNTIRLLLILVLALTGVSGWLGASGLVSPATPAVLAGGGAGLLLSLFSQFRPMTISVLADLFLILPAVVQSLTGISVCAAPH